MPAPAVVIPPITGFCIAALKPLGPVQLHELALRALAVSVSVPPSQTGFGVTVAETDVGIVRTVTEAVVTGADDPHALPAVNVYKPEPAVAIVEIKGFCSVDVKPLGPAQFHVIAPLAFPFNVSVPPAQSGLGVAVAETADGTGQVEQNMDCQIP